MAIFFLDDATRRGLHVVVGSSESAELFLRGFYEVQRAVPLLIRIFGDEPTLRAVTINPLAFLGGKRAYRFTRSVLEQELASENPDPALWEPAFWALVYMVWEREAAFDLFLDLFGREEASPGIRSSILDSVGADLCDADRRTSIFRRARRVVLEALDDPEEEVRFFALYAVGQMKLTEALASLKRMATQDHGACPGLWTVAEEAQDVIEYLTSGHWPDREPGTGRILEIDWSDVPVVTAPRRRR